VAEAVRQTQYWKQMLAGLQMNTADDVLRAMQLTRHGLGQVQTVWYDAARLEEQLWAVHYENLPADMDPLEVQRRYLQIHNATEGSINEAYRVGVQTTKAMAVTEQAIASGAQASNNAEGVKGAIQAGTAVLAGIGGTLQNAAAMDVAAYRMQTERAQREETERRLALQQRAAANRAFYGSAAVPGAMTTGRETESFLNGMGGH
jgi:conjugal transfer/entry exclusion protein